MEVHVRQLKSDLEAIQVKKVISETSIQDFLGIKKCGRCGAHDHEHCITKTTTSSDGIPIETTGSQEPRSPKAHALGPRYPTGTSPGIPWELTRNPLGAWGTIYMNSYGYHGILHPNISSFMILNLISKRFN